MQGTPAQAYQQINSVAFITAAFFLAILLIGAGIYFYFIGDMIWNEALSHMREPGTNTLILYANLNYGHTRIIVGLFSLFCGILLLVVGGCVHVHKASL